MSTLNDRDIDMDSDQEDKRAVEPMELEELDGDLDGRKEASGSPELGLAHAPALPTDRQEPANDSHVSQQSEEAPERADFLVDLDGDLVDLPASDPSNFHFDIPMPVFRPFQEPDPTERITRLCIKAISTENFKSYYGKKILGPFDQKFTAIIGPNGCGKSNTIDALLFVFGFRSAKLRAHKLPELIHNSEEHKDCTSAKVTVYFALMQSVSPAENKVEYVD
jgi:RecF/RecN/SMC N terminal domain